MLNMPNCGIVVWIYVSIGYLYSLLPPIALFLPCKISFSINVMVLFPALPVSTLYGHVIISLFDDVFRFAVITECLLSQWIEFIFTMSMWLSSSCSGSCSILWTTLLLALLQNSCKWFILLYFPHFFHKARHHLDWWLNPQYLPSCFTGLLTGVCGFLPFCFFCILLSVSF